MGQPARLEENFVIDLKSSIEIAPKGFRPRRFSRRNLPPFDPVKNEFARKLGPVGGSHSGSTSPTLSRNPTLGPKLVSALNPALIPTPIPAPAPPSSKKLFKQFVRAYLKSNQEPKQPSTERKQFLKAKVPEMYYSKSHMDCYHFCQQCKDHFKTTGAIGTNRTPFAASFLHGNISVRWT